MQKIAYLIDTIETPAAGTERQLLDLIAGLDGGRVRIRLFLLRRSDWTRKVDLEAEVLDVRRLLGPELPRGIERLARAHARERFAAIQTFFPDASILGALAARRLGRLPLIATRRNIGHWQRARDRWALRLVRRWTTHYLANSRAAARQAIATEGLDPTRVSVIYNALDLEPFNAPLDALRTRQRQAWGIRDETILIGAVANLRPVKNLAALVDATARLAQRHPVACVLVGEGPERERLRARATHAGLAERLHLPGRLDDVRPALAAFDLAVLPSTHESFSNALIEYMAAGKPIVASRVGGNAEAIEHGRNGLLFDVARADDLEAMLERCLTDRPGAAALGAQARRDALSRYNRRAILAQYENYYAHVLAAPEAPPPYAYDRISRSAES